MCVLLIGVGGHPVNVKKKKKTKMLRKKYEFINKLTATTRKRESESWPSATKFLMEFIMNHLVATCCCRVMEQRTSSPGAFRCARVTQ